MALSFSDEQINNITKDILVIPSVIDDPVNGTGFVQQKENLIVVKGELFKTDQDQETIYNYWKNNITLYFSEYDLLASSQGTSYNDADLQEGGKERGVHYPFEPQVWIPLIPKLQATNNGTPFNATSTIREDSRRDAVQLNIDTMINGFSYGSYDDPVENWVQGYFEISQSTDVDPNDLGILSSGGNTTIIRILTKTAYIPASTPPPPDPPISEVPEMITYEIVGGYTGAHSSTPNLKLSASPISNAKRGRQVPLTSEEQALLDIYETNLHLSVDDWEAHLDSQKVIIDAYDDSAPRKQANLDAGQNIVDTKGEIATWEALPVTDPNGRYTDAGLGQLETTKNTRGAFSDQRRDDIYNVQLGAGTLVQDGGSGEVTGDGIFFELWSTINLRIGKGTGTLVNYNSIDLGIALFDKKIVDATKQLEQYENIFAVTKILGDTDIGDNEFEVEDVSDFAIGQAVMVMDNESLIYRESITGIIGNIVTISNGIPVALTVGNLVRLVRER